MKKLILLTFLITTNTIWSQNIEKIIQRFNERIIFSENFSEKQYFKEILFNNSINKNDARYNKYLVVIKESISMIKNNVMNKNNLKLVRHNDLSSEIKEKMSFDIGNNNKTLFLVEIFDSKQKYITQYIYNQKNQIISFSSGIVKSGDPNPNPLYLDRPNDYTINLMVPKL